MYCEQLGYREYHQLRAYAAEFEATPAGVACEYEDQDQPEDHPRLKRLGIDVPTEFRHLIKHSDNSGFWFPVRFSNPVLIDPETWLVAGSSHMLLDELDRLGVALNISRDWSQLARGEYPAPKDDPCGGVKTGWAILRAAARLSVQHGLPIVFDG